MAHLRGPFLASCRLAILLLAASLGIRSQAPVFTIAGQVVRHTDNHPVKGARVAIRAVGHPQDTLASISDENGAFLFAGLTPGKYWLIVTYRGWSQLFKQLDQYSTAIAVGPGLDSEHIVFPLDSPASIVGSVVDEDGDPVRGATVYLFGQSVAEGVSQTVFKNAVVSGSDGSFHFAHLAPGTYYVAVSGRPWYAQNLPAMQAGAPGDQPTPRSDLDVAYPLTYSGGATSPDGATPLKLEEGARVEIQFSLHPVPSLHIALDGIDKQPDQQIVGTLSQIGPGGNLINVPAMFMNSQTFGIAPGDYILSASLSGPNPGLSGGPALIGSQVVSLTGDTTVHLNDSVKSSVNGKVIVDGDIPQNLAVVMRNVRHADERGARVARDGSFEIAQDLQPGHYALFLENTELYLQNITVKGGVYSNGELEVQRGAHIDVTITAGRGLSKVNGVVMNDHKPVPGAMVLLLPEDLSHRKYIPRDQSDSDGTFTLPSAPPGRYTLVAIDNGRDLEYGDPAVIAPYLPGGRVLDLPLRKDATLEIQVQSRTQP